jgi:hypothetical protein
MNEQALLYLRTIVSYLFCDLLFWKGYVRCSYFLLRNVTVYEDLEGVFPFQNMHIGNILIDQLSKIVSKSLTWNQQDNSSGHLIGLLR